ncbi:MAG TPA: ABC transporter permease [Verrucomicrobiae bacterium]|nr:ABC transporter permease [Verrucomicrobiae bacterium]
MYSRAYKSVVTIPPLVWVIVFLLVPYALLFCYSFWSVSPSGLIVHNWNLGNFAEMLRQPMYLATLLRSLRIAAYVTILALLLGYPVAYYLSLHASKRRDLLYQLVIIPLWASYLVRGYAWKTILGTDGVLNGVLNFLHVTNALLVLQTHLNASFSSHAWTHGWHVTFVPLSFLLYSPFAVVLMLTHIYTPFVFLPVYASLEHVPRNLIEASYDLGASPWKTFRRVVLPLSLPGIVAGATFAFVLTFGDFLAPLLVGGPSGIMISNIVASEFGAAYDWPLGAAISLCMLLLVVSLLYFTERLERRVAFS